MEKANFKCLVKCPKFPNAFRQGQGYVEDVHRGQNSLGDNLSGSLTAFPLIDNSKIMVVLSAKLRLGGSSLSNSPGLAARGCDFARQ